MLIRSQGTRWDGDQLFSENSEVFTHSLETQGSLPVPLELSDAHPLLWEIGGGGAHPFSRNSGGWGVLNCFLTTRGCSFVLWELRGRVLNFFWELRVARPFSGSSAVLTPSSVNSGGAHPFSGNSG